MVFIYFTLSHKTLSHKLALHNWKQTDPKTWEGIFVFVFSCG